MNTTQLILGNLSSLLAMVTDSFSSTRKTTKEVLVVQSISQLIYCIGTLILKGYSGAVQNVISILRNFVAIRNIKNKYVEWALVAAGVVLGICFNNLGFMGLLPVIANFAYSVAVFRFNDNERALKFVFMFSVTLFALFNLALLNIVGVFTNLIIAVSTAISLIKTRKSKAS